MKIYLAPANHYNSYCIPGYNEKTQCEKLAKLIENKLNEYNVEVKFTTVFSDTRQYDGRPEEALSWGADVYLAIHDNAYNGKTAGAQAFYHEKSELSKTLATKIVNGLNSICSVTPKLSNPIRNGMDAFSGNGYGEIREPYNRGIVPVIVEVNFHDYKPAAEYLINNQEACAESIVTSLSSVLNLSRKESETTMIKFKKGDIVTITRNITTNSKGDKIGRLYPNGTFVIYLDSYIVSSDTDNNGRTVISDENGNIIAAVYSEDLKLVTNSSEPSKPLVKTFSDVSRTQWFYEAIKYCSEKGIVNGYPNDSKFYPNRNATRAEVCQMLYNLSKYFESK